MGLPDYKNYQCTRHFLDRLDERISVPASQAKEWANRVLEHAELYVKNPDKSEVWQFKQIQIVINANSHRLISVWIDSEPGFEKRTTNPEIQSVIKKDLFQMKGRVQQRTARKVVDLFQENAVLYRKIANMRNHRNLSEYELQADQNNVAIQEELQRCDNLVEEIDDRLG
ncbi:hypothetical protein N6G95_09640 [Pediococcus inopinatus]|uniref:hypothetical protein n=1 Tax=Pediococcus inopinatus TaxID=114090 RepID=UPI002B25DF7C|nr:hypothetical protein [Pediococcus inopinatus]WPC19465.1 hypothetical protein N6G95_09640 [Pediococcus inopinatus]